MAARAPDPPSWVAPRCLYFLRFHGREAALSGGPDSRFATMRKNRLRARWSAKEAAAKVSDARRSWAKDNAATVRKLLKRCDAGLV